MDMYSMTPPWVAFKDTPKNKCERDNLYGSLGGDEECRGGYRVNADEFIYRELINTLIEDNIVEIEDIQYILECNCNNFKTNNNSAYKKTFLKTYKKIIDEFD